MQGKQVKGALNLIKTEVTSMAMCVCPVTLMQMTVITEQPNPQIQTLLNAFPLVFETPKKLPPIRSHDNTIPLLPDTTPINIRSYKLPPNQKDAIELMVKELMEVGLIRDSQSSFSSPIVMVKKKYGSWRMCVDYMQLNKHTIKNKFPIPVIEELLDELNGARIFSKLDLRSGYHHIRMNKDDIHKTTFRTHKGHYEFLVMPFGLNNALATFQSLMNTIFKPLPRKFVLVFFDDILIYSQSEKEHLSHLERVLQVMKEHSLCGKMSKCHFGVNKVEYLGHFITTEGVVTDPTKIEVMKNWPVPQTVKQLRGFLGLTGYYRSFIRHYAIISKPLTRLLTKNAFEWDENAQVAFTELKKAMTQALVLALPNFQTIFTVETDASERVWSEISMDFIVGLPKSQGKSLIFVVVDRLSKYAYFMALSHPYTASSVAQVFLYTVYKLYGLPSYIVTDRDTVFLSNFWKSLFKLLKVELKMSTAYHPQTDEAILDRRMVKLNNKAAVYVQVKWATQNEENATWELYDDLVQRFPDFQIDS
uniref:Retrotransposon-related protein n=1 Tax=Tanacetum cinerariifolium TaxID=118510 RepID=A0A6L2N6K1_TANCI|nr:retrotransposon-related protein [Tanacetum cinerariifolium]